jgi:NAD(P)-dependent dehydrogenase (short-subunit alcohol dehydrogenase family)
MSSVAHQTLLSISRQPETTDALMKAVLKAFGKVELPVNNAGVTDRPPDPAQATGGDRALARYLDHASAGPLPERLAHPTTVLGKRERGRPF